MPSSIPLQKFSFYHLPTQGRAGIKLGDAWYVSNVSIIFDCSMLYYILFWTLLGFIIHFYIIFGTNLLTGGPAQNCCFLPISVFRRNNISNGVQTEWNLRERDFWNERDPADLELKSRKLQGGHEAGRRARLLGAPPPSWMPRDSPGPTLLLCGLLLVHKKSSNWHINWTPFGIPFLWNSKTRKKTENGTGTGL